VTGVLGSHRALAGVLTLLALGAIPSVIWELAPNSSSRGTSTRDPRYATQSGGLHTAREQHVRFKTDEDVDSATETCAGLDTAFFARRFHVPADPELVARHYARRFEPAYQDRVYRGCLEGLLNGG
jgi:hypothetical protein